MDFNKWRKVNPMKQKDHPELLFLSEFRVDEETIDNKSLLLNYINAVNKLLPSESYSIHQ